MSALSAVVEVGRADRDSSRALVAAATLAGGACGALMVRSWVLGFGGLLGLAACFLGVQWPMGCWVGLFACYYAVANVIPPAVSSSLFWAGLLVFLAGCWRANLASPSSWRAVDPGVSVCAAGWLGWALLSLTHTMALESSLKEIGRYVLSLLVLFTYFHWLRDEAQIRRLVRWWMGLTLGMAWLTLAKEALRWLAARGGTSAPVLDPYPPTLGELGILFELSLPVSAALLLASPDPRRWRAWVSWGVVAAALGVTAAQSAWFSTLVGVGVLLCAYASRRTRRRLLLAAGLIGVAALGLLWRVPAVSERLLYELSGRDRVWAAAWQAIRESPLLGIGPGCWSVWFSRHFISVDFLMHDLQGNTFFLSPSKLGGEAHNVWLTKAAEMGLPSAVWLGLLLLCWFHAARRAIRQLPPGWMRTLAVGCMASMAGVVCQSMFEDGPLIGKARGADLLVTWLLVALPLAAARAAKHTAGGGAPAGFVAGRG